MTAPQLYTVELVGARSLKDGTATTSLHAKGPIEAGRLVLGETVAATGKPGDICAKVWELGDNLIPKCTMLYYVAGSANQRALVEPVALTRKQKWVSQDDKGVLLRVIVAALMVFALTCVVLIEIGANGA